MNKHSEETKKFFDQVAVARAGFYDSPSTPKCSPHVLAIREKVIKIFSGLKTIANLDVSCGNGDFTLSLARIYPQLNFQGKDDIKKLAWNYFRLNRLDVLLGCHRLSCCISKK